jgi:hypothetical protein
MSGPPDGPVEWPSPKPLPPLLPAVAAFDPALLPPIVATWALDIAERMQAPADFVAVTVMVAAGSVIGRKIAVRPQRRSDWREVPNLWGCIVGRPGVMKSPAQKAALAPVRKLDLRAAAEHTAALAEFAAESERYNIEHAAQVSIAKKKLKAGEETNLDALSDLKLPEKPPAHRYVVSDTTYEKLGLIIAENPNGVLAYRDELVSMLKPLEREENAAARGFYLTAWNGTDSYTFDRIMRGTIHIPACCLSLLGATQPGRLAAYLNHAVKGGAGDDGFAQRFGLLVWPDVSPEWQDIDRFPDAESKRAVNALFERLDAIEPDAIGAERDPFDPDFPFLRFDAEAQAEFLIWREALERRIRSGTLHPAMESHLAKYRGLVPKLALILHLLADGRGPIGLEAMLRALAWIEYLETHAARAYASVTSAEGAGARTILAKLHGGALASPFTARDVHQADWSGLGDREAVGQAIQLLVECDWLAEADRENPAGGRPTKQYVANPKGSLRELP